MKNLRAGLLLCHRKNIKRDSLIVEWQTSGQQLLSELFIVFSRNSGKIQLPSQHLTSLLRARAMDRAMLVFPVPGGP